MLFNPPGAWTDRIDPLLLLRFWHRKGCPGVYRMRTPYGFAIDHIWTPFGILTGREHPAHLPGVQSKVEHKNPGSSSSPNGL